MRCNRGGQCREGIDGHGHGIRHGGKCSAEWQCPARILPTVTLAAETASTTAEEGRFLPMVPTVTDDVQVRNVEFFVDGQRVETDRIFPFEIQ